MSRLSDQMLALLIRNAVHEARNSLFYATLYNHIGVRGFTNSSSFFEAQIAEEQGHFKKVWGYIQERNAMASLTPIPEIVGNYSDLRYAFSEALNLEFSTTEIWQEVYDLAVEINDGITKNLANEFLEIQKIEESEFMSINDELMLIGDSVPMQKLWDNTFKF